MEGGRGSTHAEDGGMSDLFDHIEDLLDFPNDDDLFLLHFPPLSLPLQCDGNGDVDRLLSCNDNGGSSDAFFGVTDVTNISNSSHEENHNLRQDSAAKQQNEEFDIIPLEWMSQFLEESDAMSLSLPNNNQFHEDKGKEDSFRTSSPISVLEPSNRQSISNGNGNGNNHTKSFSSSSSSSSSSFPYCNSTNCSTIQEEEEAAAVAVGPVGIPVPISAVPARIRTKRPRPAATITIPMKQEQTNSIFTPNSDPESIGESHPARMKKKKDMKKKKKVNTAACPYRSDADDEYTDGGQAATHVRKCLHCRITKTPQWRAGPMGPKTLCNACGVRYKSGRLFPEYRPAASPTFVPSLHSNSHKKVVEMRNKATNNANSCDLLDYIRRSQKMSLLN